MRLRLFKLAIFLLLGAVVNVAVALGLSIWDAGGSETALTYPTTLRELHLQFGSSLRFESNWVGGREVKRLGFSGRSIEGITAGNSPALYSRFDFSAGWLARSLRGTALVEADQLKVVNAMVAPRTPHSPPCSYLPLQPIWDGMTVNTIVYAGLVWVVLGMLRVIRGHIRELLLRCPECGYDLRGNLEHGCPECGWRRGERSSAS